MSFVRTHDVGVRSADRRFLARTPSRRAISTSTNPTQTNLPPIWQGGGGMDFVGYMQAWASLRNPVRSSASGPPGSGGIERHSQPYWALGGTLTINQPTPARQGKTGNFRAHLRKDVQNPSVSPLTVETSLSRPYKFPTCPGSMPIHCRVGIAPIPLPNITRSQRLTHHVRKSGRITPQVM